MKMGKYACAVPKARSAASQIVTATLYMTVFVKVESLI